MSRLSRTRGRGPRLLLVALLALAALPASASGWSAPQNLTHSGFDAGDPAVGLADDGTSVFAWLRDDGLAQRIQLRTSSVAGALGPVQTLSAPSTVEPPALAVDPSGRAAVAWRRHDGTRWHVELAVREAGGAVVGPLAVSDPAVDAGPPDVGIDDTGDVVVAWRSIEAGGDRIQMRSYTGVTPDPVVDLVDSSVSLGDPVVDVAATGAAAVAWRRIGAASRIQAVQIPAGGAAGAARTLSGPGAQATSPDVGVADDGSTVVVWDRSGAILLRGLSAAGAFAPTQRLSHFSHTAEQPAVAVNATGEAIGAFVVDPGAAGRVQVVRRDGAGVLSGRRYLSGPGHAATLPEIELADDGRAMGTWYRPDVVLGRVLARAYHADGTRGAARRLNRLGEPAAQPAIAINQTDGSAAAWQRVVGADQRVQGSVGAPEIGLDPGPNTFTEGDPFLTLDSGMTVRDDDGQTLETATVKLMGGQPGDSLGSFDFGTVTWSWNDTTDEMTLTGPGPVSDFQAVLQTAFFDNDEVNPDTTARSVEVTATDGLFTSAPQTQTINVVAQNRAPENTVPGTQTFDEDTTLAFSTGNGNAISIADPDAGGADVETTLTATSGAMSIDTTGLAFTAGDGTSDATMTFEGTLTEINAALQTLVYSPPPDHNGTADQITITTDDLGNTGAGGAQSDTDNIGLSITAINDAPQNTVPAAQSVDEDTALTLSTGNGNALSTADADAGASDVRATLDVDNGTMILGSDPGLNFGCVGCAGDGAGDATMIFEGTVAEVNAAIDGLSYQGTLNFNGADTLTFTVNDLGNTGTGGALGDTQTVGITVNPVNDAPVADDETFDGNDSAHGNTTLQVDDPSDDKAAPSHPHTEIVGDILDGDTDVDGPGPLTVTPETKATSDNGSVTIEADGDFVFHPAASTSCTDTSDSFTYTLEDNDPTDEQTDTGTVTIAIAGCVWYVNNNDPSGDSDNGTASAPFDTLAQAETASGANHTVFVFDGDNTPTGYDAGGYAMNTGERLIGEHEGLTVDQDHGTGNNNFTADTLHPAAANSHPTLTATAADVIDLAPNNEIRGFNIDPQNGGGGIFGGSGDANGTIDSVNIVDTFGTNGTQAGLELNGAGGTFDISDFTTNQSNAPGVLLTGGLNPATVDFAGDTGTVTLQTNGAPALRATGPNVSMGTSQIDDIVVTNSNDGGVDLGGTTGTTILGDGNGTDLSLTTTSGAEPALDLNNAGTVTVGNGGTDNVSATGGPAVDVTGTSGPTLEFDDVSSTNSSSDGINLDGLGTGTFSATGGTITGADGISFDLNGGTGAITYPGTFGNHDGNNAAFDITGRGFGANAVTLSGSISDTGDNGGGINVSGNSGGSTVFSGATKQLNTGTLDAIDFQSSDNHTLTFQSGGLDIDTTSGRGVDAATSGVLGISGGGNTIDTGAGRGLSLLDTDIADGDLTFQRISSNGADRGISLTNTGNANGRLFVTGAGGTCSSAANCTGGGIQNSTGAGVLLSNVPGGAEFMRLGVVDSADQGVDATSVSNGILLDRSFISSNGNGSAENGVDLNNVTGVSAIRSSDVIGSGTLNDGSSNIDVTHTSGTMNLTVNDNDLNLASTDDGIQVTGGGSGTLLTSITGNRFDDNKGDAISVVDEVSNTVVSHHTITGNTINGKAGTATDGGIVYTTDGTSRATINNNDVDAVSVSGVIVNPLHAESFDATASNNTIGTAGVQLSGSEDGDGMQLKSVTDGTSRVVMSNNSIRGWQGAGMRLRASESTTGGTTHLTAQSNTIGDWENDGVGGVAADAGIWLQSGSSVADVQNICANVGGAGGLANTLVGGPVTNDAIADFVLDLRFANSQMRAPNYTGTTETNRRDHFFGRNTGFSVFAQDGVQNMGNEADGSCDQPTAPTAPTAPPALGA